MGEPLRTACAWVWGAGLKSRLALEELDRIAGRRLGSVREFQHEMRKKEGMDFVSIPDLSRGAHSRFRDRYEGLPSTDEVLRFGAPNLQTMAGGLVTRARERNALFREVVFEDHGIGPGDPQIPNATATLLFFGADAVTLRSLPQFGAYFMTMRDALADDARVVLMHCWAFSDGGKLALELSALLGCPVLGMNGEQVVGDQRIQGAVFRAHEDRVDRASGLSPWVVYFD